MVEQTTPTSAQRWGWGRQPVCVGACPRQRSRTGPGSRDDRQRKWTQSFVRTPVHTTCPRNMTANTSTHELKQSSGTRNTHQLQMAQLNLRHSVQARGDAFSGGLQLGRVQQLQGGTTHGAARQPSQRSGGTYFPTPQTTHRLQVCTSEQSALLARGDCRDAADHLLRHVQLAADRCQNFAPLSRVREVCRVTGGWLVSIHYGIPTGRTALPSRVSTDKVRTTQNVLVQAARPQKRGVDQVGPTGCRHNKHHLQPKQRRTGMVCGG